MSLRALLIALTVAATAAFVVGVRIESGDEAAHHEAAGETATPSDEHQETGADEGEEHAEGEPAAALTSTEDPHTELRPLGLDVEASPFVAAAALASLALAAAAWLRPTLTSLLTFVAVAMLAFAVLDVRGSSTKPTSTRPG